MVGYTSIEQAKKLIEIGIDTNTADMHYFSNLKIPCVLSYSQMLEHFKAKQSELNNSGINTDVPDLIPCWSTEALMKILPSKIVVNGEGLEFLFRKHTNVYETGYQDMLGLMYNSTHNVKNTLLECAYETILELKELKLV